MYNSDPYFTMVMRYALRIWSENMAWTTQRNQRAQCKSSFEANGWKRSLASSGWIEPFCGFFFTTRPTKLVVPKEERQETHVLQLGSRQEGCSKSGNCTKSKGLEAWVATPSWPQSFTWKLQGQRQGKDQKGQGQERRERAKSSFSGTLDLAASYA